MKLLKFDKAKAGKRVLYKGIGCKFVYEIKTVYENESKTGRVAETIVLIGDRPYTYTVGQKFKWEYFDMCNFELIGQEKPEEI